MNKTKMADRELHALVLPTLEVIYELPNSEITESLDKADCDIDSEKFNSDFGDNMIGQNRLLDQQNAERDLPIDTNNNNTLFDLRGNAATIKSTPSVTIRDLIFLIIPILTHAYDLINDIYLTVDYFTSKQTVYGWLTFALIIIPAITSTWISSRMQEEDSQQEVHNPEEDENPNLSLRVAKLKLSFIIVMLFQLPLPLRCLRSLGYAWMVLKCEKERDTVGQDRYYRKMLKEQEDLALLNVIQCFLESALQLTLQLTILLIDDKEIKTTMWFKIFGGCVTLFTLGWSMKKYHCAIRLAQPALAVISASGGAMIFLWHFGTIATRIFLLGIAASNWFLYTLVVCTVIWIGCTFWLYAEDRVFEFCRDKSVPSSSLRTNMERFRTTVFAGILAVVYMFTFVNLREGSTCIRYLIYHGLCGLQNAVVVALWCTFADHTSQYILFSQILVILSVILFITGISGMIMYYTRFHPTVKNRRCISVADRCLSCIECGLMKN